MTVWFTSDTHYDHARVIEYSGRHAWARDVDAMNEHMVRAWNERVRPGDLVYHLGDFCLGRPERAAAFAGRLLGQKYLVLGNHDKRLRSDKAFLVQWVWARDYAEVTVDGQKIILSHYAMMTWNGSHRGSWQLHGHSHGSLRDDPGALRLDVGVDCWGGAPVSFGELRARMARKTFVPVDHHGAE